MREGNGRPDLLQDIAEVKELWEKNATSLQEVNAERGVLDEAVKLAGVLRAAIAASPKTPRNAQSGHPGAPKGAGFAAQEAWKRKTTWFPPSRTPGIRRRRGFGRPGPLGAKDDAVFVAQDAWELEMAWPRPFGLAGGRGQCCAGGPASLGLSHDGTSVPIDELQTDSHLT